MERILFVNLEGTIGGAETSLVLTAKSLRTYFELAVACPCPSPLAEVLADHAIIAHSLPTHPRLSYRSPLCCLYWARTACRLLKLVRVIKPDLLHANNLCAGIACAVAALATNTKLLLHMRDLVHLGLPSRVCSWFCHRVVAVSGAVRDELGRCGVPPGKITVLHNAVEDGCVESADGGMLHKGENLHSDSFTFAHIGQFVPWKNHSLFLDAAARVARELPNGRFVLVGDDVFRRDSRYRREVLGRIESSPVAGRITLTGWQDDMAQVWPWVDCLVHTADREPFGRVIIEAMAHGIPVIAVGSCGPAEIIGHDESGILVPPRDPRALSLAMLQMARDRQLCGVIAMAGRERVRSRFTMAQMVPRLLQVYREVLAG